MCYTISIPISLIWHGFNSIQYAFEKMVLCLILVKFWNVKFVIFKRHFIMLASIRFPSSRQLLFIPCKIKKFLRILNIVPNCILITLLFQKHLIHIVNLLLAERVLIPLTIQSPCGKSNSWSRCVDDCRHIWWSTLFKLGDSAQYPLFDTNISLPIFIKMKGPWWLY